MKNRKKASQTKAVTTIIRKLKAVGLRPTFHILDNEVSTDLIEFLKTDENITVQLAPAGRHRRNAAEKSIRTFKNHFIAGLCTSHKFYFFPVKQVVQPLTSGCNNVKSPPHLSPQPKTFSPCPPQWTLRFQRHSNGAPGIQNTCAQNPPYGAHVTPTPAMPDNLAPPFIIIGATTSTFWRHMQNASLTL